MTLTETEILPVDPSQVGYISEAATPDAPALLGKWSLQLDASSQQTSHLQLAASELKHSNQPVAFPTETVYGLGADATRSEAVKGIYNAKGRPSDNPLIVHVHSLEQLRILLGSPPGLHDIDVTNDPIPPIYLPLIRKFWPGPLTLLMPKSPGCALAPEVTAGLPTFGARMPSNIVALALIRLANVPVAAPSANASTKPSPTAAEHVKNDLNGRIKFVIDGGPCEIGVESTVVDGLCDPPLILRPGGITLEELRQVPGWERVQKGYKDASEVEDKPRAPGMKYRHYSPAAEVTLLESGSIPPSADLLEAFVRKGERVGFIRTTCWTKGCGLPIIESTGPKSSLIHNGTGISHGVIYGSVPKPQALVVDIEGSPEVFDVSIGSDAKEVARGLFSALREMDLRKVDRVFVEGIDERTGDVAAAVMNRLRKAARNIVT